MVPIWMSLGTMCRLVTAKTKTANCGDSIMYSIIDLVNQSLGPRWPFGTLRFMDSKTSKTVHHQLRRWRSVFNLSQRNLYFNWKSAPQQNVCTIRDVSHYLRRTPLYCSISYTSYSALRGPRYSVLPESKPHLFATMSPLSGGCRTAQPMEVGSNKYRCPCGASTHQLPLCSLLGRMSPRSELGRSLESAR